jgi:hypothetical protein
MTTYTRIATLQADLERAETRLKLATASGNWRDVAAHATEAVRLEEELGALMRGVKDEGPRNIVGTVKVHG